MSHMSDSNNSGPGQCLSFLFNRPNSSHVGETLSHSLSLSLPPSLCSSLSVFISLVLTPAKTSLTLNANWISRRMQVLYVWTELFFQMLTQSSSIPLSRFLLSNHPSFPQNKQRASLNTTALDRRLRFLEARHAEADALLHVHASLLFELQVQLRNLSVTIEQQQQQQEQRP